MKIATKFALAFLACGVFSVVVYAAVAASREVDRLESTVAEDLASLGRTLRTSVLAVWERDGEARAFELVGFHDAAEEPAAIDVRLTWLDVDQSDSHAPKGGLSVVPSLRRGMQRTWVGVRPDGARHIYAYVPLLREGHRPAALELSRPLIRESDLFWQALREQLLSAAIVASFAAVMAIVVSGWIVSAPLMRVSAQARRIGAGDLSQRLPERGSDEVATVVRELNAMCDQLRDARAHAEEETEKRVAAIEQLRHADRLRTVGTLASGIAHELGTPLNVISMRAKMIATGEIPGTEAPASAQIIVSQTERVTKIVRQLLDFARRRPPKRGRTDVGVLAERTAQLLEGLAKKARVAIAVQRSGEVVANVDAMQIEQALTNLVINAVHAMPEGGNIELSSRVETAKNRPCAVLAVRDEGTGISKENLDRIYEPFFTTKAVGDGTGLGLSVTHGIVADHEGWMEIDSEVGRGTTVTLYLPVESKAEAS